jgi:PKD domain/PASTA domain
MAGGRSTLWTGGAALLALIVLALAASVAAAPTWLLPAATISEAGATEPAIAVDPAGNVVALWARHNGSSYVVEARARPVGGPWGPVEPLGGTGTVSGSPRVAVDNAGNAVAVWKEAAAIRAAVRPAGGSWTPGQTLASGQVDAPDVAVNAGGDAIAVWRSAGAHHAVQAAYGSAASGAWGQSHDVFVPMPVKQVFPLDVALDSAGNAAVAWIYFETLSSKKLQASFRSAGAPSWEPAADLTGLSSGCCAAQVGFAAGAGALLSGETPGVVKVTHRSAGGSWGAPQTLGPGDPSPQLALAIGPGGDAVAAWKRGLAVDVASRPAATGVWSAPRPVTTAAEADPPHLAVDPSGNALATWVLWDGARRNIELARGVVATNTWQGSIFVSARGSEAVQPKVGLDAAGNGVAIFVEQADLSSPSFVRAAAFDVAGPVFSGLSIPAAATAGAPVSFAVSSLDTWSLVQPGPVWDFGDGTFALGGNVTHAYSAPGTYTVTVIHSDAVANATTLRGTIAVAAPPAPPPPPPTPPQLRRCVVPRVVGRTLARANAAIRKARCRTGRVRRAYAKRRTGIVVAQTPRAGRRLAVGARVHLVVSRGRKPQRR